MDAFAAYVLAVVALVVLAVCFSAWALSLRDLVGRSDIDPGERTLWLVALLLFPPVAGLVYLRCGPGEGCVSALFGRVTA